MIQKRMLPLLLPIWNDLKGKTARVFRLKYFMQALIFWKSTKVTMTLFFLILRCREVAREIRSKDQSVGIIFITSLAQYAIEGYAVQAIDFMVKPVGYYNFSTKLQKAFRFIETHREKDILINNKEGIFRIRVSEILYIEKERDYLLFHMKEDCFSTIGSIKEIKDKMSGLPFSECTSGCLVHLHYIKRIGKDSVLLTSGQELPLSRRQKKTFTQDYIQFMGGM